MRYVLVADVHAHNFAMFAKPIKCYGNTRFKIIADALLHAGETAKSIGAQLLIAGDLFHTRGTISVMVQNVIHDVLEKIVSWGVEVIIIAGNHDQATKDGSVTSLGPLKSLVRVCTEFEVYGEFAFLPFREDPVQIKDMFDRAAAEGVDFVLAHLAIDGAVVGDSEYQPKESVRVLDLGLDRFKWVFMGHYHRTQLVHTNAMYLGSLCPHNFADTEAKGFWVFDSENMNLEFVSSVSPQFVNTQICSEADIKRFMRAWRNAPDDFYKLKVIRGLKLPEFNGNIIIEWLPETEQTARITGVDQMQDVEVLARYCEIKDVETKIKSVGLDILREAKETP